MIKHFAFWLLLIIGADTFGQHIVTDIVTGETIPNAHIIIFDLNNQDSVIHKISDANGIFNFQIEKPSIIHISYVGYKTMVDTLQKGEAGNFRLKPDVFNLEAFVVTASCEPQMADKSIYEIQVISKKDIETKGANNLSELLNNQLNMKINMDPSLGAGITLQGLSGEHIKLLIDGVPVVGRKNGNIDLSQINLNQVDHVEIIEGPMSVIYGSNAIAGVINIITKSSTQKKFEAYAGSYLESVGVYNFEAGTEISRKQHQFRVHGARNFFDGFSLNPDRRSMNWKPKRQLNSDLSYSYRTEKYKIRLDFSIFDEVLQDKGDLMAPYYETAFDQYFYTTRTSTRLDYTLKLKSFKQLNIMNAVSTYNWHKNTFLKDLTTLDELLTSSPDQHDTTIFYAFVGRGIFGNDQGIRKLTYQIGYDINYETAGGKRIEGDDQSIGDFAGFISLNYKGIKNLKLQPGLRYSYNTKYESPLVYSLNAQYKTKKLSLRASAAKGFRAPSIKELFLNFQDINHNIVGNPNLKAENSNNFNFSSQYIIEKNDLNYAINLSGYHNTVRDIITLAIMQGAQYSYTNLSKYITKGFDAGVQISYYPRLKLDLSYGYLGTYSDASVSDKFLYSPAITSNIEFYAKKLDTRLNVFYKYTGKLPQLAIDSDGELFESYIPDYHNLEFSINRSFFKNSLKVIIGAKNLFNNTMLASTTSASGAVHGGGGNIPVGWGRTVFINVIYKFTRY